MRLIALLSWFDEPPELLALCLDGAKRAGCSAVVAVDGRYAMFPSMTNVSDPKQRAVIDAACRHHGLELTTHVSGPWTDEAAKRTVLFALALAVSDRGDWWINLDADTIVTEVDAGLLRRLAETEEDAALARVVDVEARRARRPDWPEQVDFRLLFRAQPLYVEGHHYDYRRMTDDAFVWRGGAGWNENNGVVPAANLADLITVEHRPAARDPGRVLLKNQYYTRRDEQGAEMGRCLRCETGQARHRVYAGLKLVRHEGARRPVGRVEELCDGCAREQRSIARRWLRQNGFNPDQITFHESYAAPGRQEQMMKSAVQRTVG